MDCVNISGLLKNLLASGFNTRDCIGEMLDNCIGAKSNNINIILNTKLNILIFSDDGCGMTKEELGISHILHNRTDTSIEKDGRYGIGGKHARSHFTQNIGIAKTISKFIDTEHNNNEPNNNEPNDKYENINTVEIDYDYCIKNNILKIHPDGIKFSDAKIWDKYAINQFKKGTIVYINCHPSITEEIKMMFETTNICNSISYYIASTYNETIEIGTKIKIICDSKEYNIEPIDPINWNTISDKKETIIQLYKNKSDETNETNETNETPEIHCYFEDKDDIVYRDYSSSDKGKNIKIYKSNYNKCIF